jgi:regulator of replication initiation timing
VENPAIIGPALGAVIAGVFLLLGHRVLTYWTAREGRKTTLRANQDAAAVAKVTTDEQDRARISKDYQWTIDDLRREVTTLYARQGEMRAQLDSLGTELDTVRRANTALRVENDQLKEQLSSETAKHEVLKQRVDSLDAANIILRRELHRHGIAVPALAKEPAAP